MSRTFAIGDIHGCCRTFQKLLLEKLRISKSDTLYCVGDYIDRGADSKGVLDFIIELRKSGYQVYTIRGNHEQMMLEARDDEMMWQLWNRNGGDTTMKSFGVKEMEDIDPVYFTMLEAMPFYIRTGNHIIVHAGLNFSKKNYWDDTDSMLWMRDADPWQPLLGDQLLFHGHTPKTLDYILNQEGNCYNIDGGCVYNKFVGLGYLVAINLGDMEYTFVENCE